MLAASHQPRLCAICLRDILQVPSNCFFTRFVAVCTVAGCTRCILNISQNTIPHLSTIGTNGLCCWASFVTSKPATSVQGKGGALILHLSERSESLGRPRTVPAFLVPLIRFHTSHARTNLSYCMYSTTEGFRASRRRVKGSRGTAKSLRWGE